MFAVSVLMALGQPIEEAEGLVSRAGSKVETMAQMEMLSWCETRAAK
jgi:predicted ATPase with chaperone activity